MSTVVVVHGVKSPCTLVSVTHVFSYGVSTGVKLHTTNPVNEVSNYTPALVPFKTVKPVPPLPGGSGGAGTVGYAF